jgi:protein phosphatase
MHIVTTYTHQGQRRYQEDAVGTKTFDNGAILVFVADGLGGHPNGDQASACVAKHLLQVPSQTNLANQIAMICQAIQAAHREMKVHYDQRATTLSAALISDGTVTFLHAGDSYCLGIRNSKTEQLMSLDETPRGSITNCLGLDPFEIRIQTMPFEGYSHIILCTDGVDEGAFPKLPEARDAMDVVTYGMREYARHGLCDNATAVHVVLNWGPQPVDEDVD